MERLRWRIKVAIEASALEESNILLSPTAKVRLSRHWLRRSPGWKVVIKNVFS